MVLCFEPPLRSTRNQRQENVPKHIFTPRTYQVEILDAAIKRNTIVCLSANNGKTFIAVMLARQLAHQVRPSLSQGGKRTILLVNKASAVEQQGKFMRLHTDLNVGVVTQAGSSWSEEEWTSEFSKHNLLVLPGSAFLTAITHHFINLCDVNLLIFDECHHSTNADHPYAQIMQHYKSFNGTSKPRILGLTACVITKDIATPDELNNTLHTLESSLNSTAEMATDILVGELTESQPEEVVDTCLDYTDKTGLISQIDEILENAVIFLSDSTVGFNAENGETDPLVVPSLALSEVRVVLKELGPWGAGRLAQSFITQIERMEEFEPLSLPKRFLAFAHTHLRLVSSMMERIYEKEVRTIEDFLEYMSPKVLQIMDILHRYKPDDNFMIIGDDNFDDIGSGDETDDSLDLSGDEFESNVEKNHKDKRKKSEEQVHYVAVKRTSCNPVKKDANGDPIPVVEKEDEGLCSIIFVDREHIAFTLNKLIQELCNWDPDLFFVQSTHITDHANVRGAQRNKEQELHYKKQEDMLRKFRNKELNMLVATNVLEEGVDVPRCNLVIRYNLPKTYRSYIQGKGHARAKKSRHFMLVEESYADEFLENLSQFKGIESILMSKCRGKQDGDEEKVEEGWADSLLPPYVPVSDEKDVSVKMSTAIALVNRYCAKLPSDAFTHLTPQCQVMPVREEGKTTQYYAILQLPINSPIKEPITGPLMSSKRLSKMAVALKTCQILHQQGEIDDNLLPVGKEVIKYEDEEGEWEEHEALGQARPGTTKRKQYYRKKIADALIGCPSPDASCHLYVITMILTSPITEEQNTRGRRLHPPEETSAGFGILCERRIPLVPHFPVFTRSGEVTISIDLVSSDTLLSSEQLKRLSEFHHVLFERVLRLEKDPMVYDSSVAESSYFLVPLEKDSRGQQIIDWKFIEHVENAPPPVKREDLFESKRPKFEFDENLFKDAVVMPSYRNINQPQYFYVAEIRHDLTPKSPFPSPEVYDTFEQYYSAKYGLKITNVDQPLLDVDHTSARLNLLTPRYMNQKGVALPTSSAETRRARRENLQQKQILIPELCDVHPFPASLWRKAVCLPAILYRLNCLLIAEEIRVTVAQGAHIGVVRLPDDFRFDRLEFGFSTSPSDNVCISAKDDKPETAGVCTDVPKMIEAESVSTSSSQTKVDVSGIDQKTQLPDEELPNSTTLPNDDVSASDELSKKSSSTESTASDSATTTLQNSIPSVDGDLSQSVQESASNARNTLHNNHSTNAPILEDIGPEELLESSSGCIPPLKSGETSSHNIPNDCVLAENGPLLTASTDLEGMISSDADTESVESSSSPSSSSASLVSSSLTCNNAKLNCVSQGSSAESQISDLRSNAAPMEDKLTCAKDSALRCSDVSCQHSPGCDRHIPDTISIPCHLDDPHNHVHKLTSNHAEKQSAIPGVSQVDEDAEIPRTLMKNDCDVKSETPEKDESDLINGEFQMSNNHVINSNHKSECTKPVSAHANWTAENHMEDGRWKINLDSFNKDGSLLMMNGLDLVVDSVPGPKIMEVADDGKPRTGWEGGERSRLDDNVTAHKNPSKWNADDITPTTKFSFQVTAPDTPDSKQKQTKQTPPKTTSPPEGSKCDERAIHNHKKAADVECNRMVGELNESKYEDVYSSVSPAKSSCNSVDGSPAACNVGAHVQSAQEADDHDDSNPRPPQNPANTSTSDMVTPDDSSSSDFSSSESDYDTAHESLSHASSEMSLSDETGANLPVLDTAAATSVVPDSCHTDQATAETTQQAEPHAAIESKAICKRQPCSCHEKSTKSCSLCNYVASAAGGEEMDYTPLVSFDDDVDLETYIGPSPCLILQALTMSNANDFFNLERLETIGDSFLKFAITIYLYCEYSSIHEGKLSYLRSKQVSNYNLYRLGKRKGLPNGMVAAKLEPTENWLPPGFVIKKNNAYRGLNVVTANDKKNKDSCDTTNEKKVVTSTDLDAYLVNEKIPSEMAVRFNAELVEAMQPEEDQDRVEEVEGIQCLIPYKLQTQHSLPDKSIADCVEALIGCYLTCCGQQAALQFMSWLGLKVLPDKTPDSPAKKSSSTQAKLFTDREKAIKISHSTISHSRTEFETSVPCCHTDVSDAHSFMPDIGRNIPAVDSDSCRFNGSCSCSSVHAGNVHKCFDICVNNTAKCEGVLTSQIYGVEPVPTSDLGVVEKAVGSHQISLMDSKDAKCLIRVRQERSSHVQNISKPPQSPHSFGRLQPPPSPLLNHIEDAESQLEYHLDGYRVFEDRIRYYFKDRSYLLQAFTHASYHYNKVTDCYQRLEFLGDAILDYVITRHLFEDIKKHSPGILTDLRSALVNNNIFAALAVKWDFHKYFKAVSPQLFKVIDKFVTWQKDRNDEINLDEEFGDVDDDNEHEGEDIEIPKALGDIFESVAGAIYLDSGMSLDTVWQVYYRLMKPQIDSFTENIPKSPVRELLEMEPETAKFEKPERTMDGKIRVTVNVVGKGQFRGIGRNYRIAKSAAAKRALKAIRLIEQHMERQNYMSSHQLPYYDNMHFSMYQYN